MKMKIGIKKDEQLRAKLNDACSQHWHEWYCTEKLLVPEVNLDSIRYQNSLMTAKIHKLISSLVKKNKLPYTCC
jgi:hypothetical protein